MSRAAAPILCGVLAAACATVPAGHAALVNGPGGLGEPLGEGVHLVGLLSTTELVDLREQERDDDLHALTADGAEVEAGTSLVTYRLAPDELRQLAREVGTDVYRVAVGPTVGSVTRRVLGRLQLAELDTEHLRAAQEEITRLAAAELRPLHVLLERVDLRQVSPVSRTVNDGYTAAAALEQQVLAIPDRQRLASERAGQRRVQARGIADSWQQVAPTLGPRALQESRSRALGDLLVSPRTSVEVGPRVDLEVVP